MGTTGFNIAVQDGATAGQTVPHVHVHILPRRARDFANNDDVYTELDNIGKPGFERVARSAQAMADEATELRALFPAHLNTD